VSSKGRHPFLQLRLRMALVMVLPCLIVSGVLAKVYVLQNVEGAELQRRYEAQHQDRFELKSRRGMIRDRMGRVLAGTVEVESLALRPGLVVDRPTTVARLAEALGSSREWVQAKLDSRRPFEWLRRHADPVMVERVRRLGLPGVLMEREFMRSWPLGPLAGQLLGFTDIDGRGRAGLEGAFDEVLAGQSRWVDGLRDGMRHAIFASGLLASDPMEGKSLTLTIDSVVQQIAEEELQAGLEEHGAKRGVAIVLEPKTGDLLALALAPSFDPNSRRKEPERFNNWAVTEVYEPGSVMKVFTLVAALDAGVVELTTPVHCEHGSYRIGRHTIHDHSPAGTLSALEVLTVSSNIGIAKIAEKLGKERLRQALVRMGLNERTGADAFFPRETLGLLTPAEKWPAIQLANVAFGQGIAVTWLQLASALAGLANGGELMRPRLVLRTEEQGKSGKIVQEHPPLLRRRVVSREAAQVVTRAMVSAVNHARGTGSRARVPGFTVAGKTGTAQKVDHAAGIYADRWVGTFFGFLPAEDPQLVLLVSLDEPEPVHYGGVVAAPVFSRIAQRTLTYLGIYGQPGEEQRGKKGQPPNAVAAVPAPGPAAPAGSPRGAAVPGPQQIVRQQEADGPMVVLEEPEADGLAGGELPQPVLVPSFAGLSMRAALALAEREGLLLELEGSGQVVQQDPPAGEPVPQGTHCRVRFANQAGGGVP